MNNFSGYVTLTVYLIFCLFVIIFSDKQNPFKKINKINNADFGPYRTAAAPSSVKDDPKPQIKKPMFKFKLTRLNQVFIGIAAIILAPPLMGWLYDNLHITEGIKCGLMWSIGIYIALVTIVTIVNTFMFFDKGDK